MIRASDRIAAPDPDWDPADPDPATSDAPFRLYNIGNNAPVGLADFIAELEAALGKPAIRELLPMQPGDVRDTYADSTRLARARQLAPGDADREGRGALRGLVPRLLRRRRPRRRPAPDGVPEAAGCHADRVTAARARASGNILQFACRSARTWALPSLALANAREID